MNNLILNSTDSRRKNQDRAEAKKRLIEMSFIAFLDKSYFRWPLNIVTRFYFDAKIINN